MGPQFRLLISYLHPPALILASVHTLRLRHVERQACVGGVGGLCRVWVSWVWNPQKRGTVFNGRSLRKTPQFFFTFSRKHTFITNKGSWQERKISATFQMVANFFRFFLAATVLLLFERQGETTPPISTGRENTLVLSVLWKLYWVSKHARAEPGFLDPSESVGWGVREVASLAASLIPPSLGVAEIEIWNEVSRLQKRGFFVAPVHVGLNFFQMYGIYGQREIRQSGDFLWAKGFFFTGCRRVQTFRLQWWGRRKTQW